MHRNAARYFKLSVNGAIEANNDSCKSKDHSPRYEGRIMDMSKPEIDTKQAASVVFDWISPTSRTLESSSPFLFGSVEVRFVARTTAAKLHQRPPI